MALPSCRFEMMLVMYLTTELLNCIGQKVHAFNPAAEIHTQELSSQQPHHGQHPQQHLWHQLIIESRASKIFKAFTLLSKFVSKYRVPTRHLHCKEGLRGSRILVNVYHFPLGIGKSDS